MSETAASLNPNASVTKVHAAALWQPILLRSMLTLLFGIITVFFGAPEVLGLCLNLGWYFVALALTQLWFVRRLDLSRDNARRRALLAAAAVLAVSGVVIFVSINVTVAVWLGGAALASFGAAELFAALHKGEGSDRARAQKAPLRSDWLISGTLGLGTGLLLPFFAEAGPHGLLGVAGGGALMTGALWLLSALTIRHDARKPKS